MDFDEYELRKQLEIKIYALEQVIEELYIQLKYHEKLRKEFSYDRDSDRIIRDVCGISITMITERISNYKDKIYKYKDELYNQLLFCQSGR